MATTFELQTFPIRADRILTFLRLMAWLLEKNTAHDPEPWLSKRLLEKFGVAFEYDAVEITIEKTGVKMDILCRYMRDFLLEQDAVRVSSIKLGIVMRASLESLTRLIKINPEEIIDGYWLEQEFYSWPFSKLLLMNCANGTITEADLRMDFPPGSDGKTPPPSGSDDKGCGGGTLSGQATRPSSGANQNP